MAALGPEKLPAIESMILRGIEGSLAEVFELDVKRVIFFASTNKIQVATAVAKFHDGPDGAVKWPLLLLHVNSVTSGSAENMHGVNSRTLARRGVYLKTADSQAYVVNQKMVPAVFEFEVIYMTDNFPDSFKYANQWVANAINNRLNFSITYMGKSFDIRTEMSAQISTPDSDAAVDIPNVFEYTSTVKVAGYITDQHVDALSKVQLLRKPVINVSIDPSASLDRTIYNSGHKMPIVEEMDKQ